MHAIKAVDAISNLTFFVDHSPLPPSIMSNGLEKGPQELGDQSTSIIDRNHWKFSHALRVCEGLFLG